MFHFYRTDSKNEDFISLVALLDKDLAQRDGDDHAFYHQFNGIDLLDHCIVVYLDEKPIACGAIKSFDETAMEIKRMYVRPNLRGKGIATKMLTALEVWARELGYRYCVLETGKRQPEAIALYKKNNYQIIPNYAPYEGVENSVCFRKDMPPQSDVDHKSSE